MTPIILTEKVDLTAKETEKVREAQVHEGYLLIKQLLAARQAEALASYMDASVYDTENAKALADTSKAEARRFAAALEVLDLLEEPGQALYRIKLDQRR